MRLIGIAAFAGVYIASALSAQTLPVHAVRNAAPVNPTSEFHIVGGSLTPMLLAEWDAENATGLGKTVQIVWGKDAVDKAPAKASKYEQKTYSFPTGTIRLLEFSKAKGGMIHAITVETAIFMLKGSGTVEVAGRTVSLQAGDAVNYPSGVLRGEGDATVIAWTVTGTLNNEASKAAVVRGAEAPVSHSAEWDEGGKRVRARTPEELTKAPADAIRLSVKRYAFDGNSVRVANSKKGGPTSPTSSELDALIYVTSGKLRFFHDDQSIEAMPGDAIREIAGHQHHWYRIEDSSFVAISSLPVIPLAVAKP
jgi:quercetin dioxygenase-like cupin family protein